MEQFYTAILVLILLPEIQTKDKGCHQYIDDAYAGTYANCSYMDFTTIPRHLPINITTLNMTGNHITILFNYDFQHVPNLRRLDLRFNPIKAFHELTFVGLSRLRQLILYGHQLDYTDSSIPHSVFKPLKQLDKLSLRSDVGRFISSQIILPDEAIGYLRSITYLNIDTTSKTVFNSGFSNLTNLKELIIGKIKIDNVRFQCGLKVFNGKTFRAFSNSTIHTIKLNGCTMFEYNADFLQPFPDLKNIFMVDIQMMNGTVADVINAFDIFVYRNISQIIITDFRSNYFNMGQGALVSFENISKICVQHLEIRDCQIDYIDTRSLFTIPFPPIVKCLKSLILTSNQITGVLPKSALVLIQWFSNLEIIDMSLQKTQSVQQYSASHARPAMHNNTFPVPIFLPSKIKYINFAGLTPNIGDIADVLVFNGNNLQFLNLSYCGLSNFNHTIMGIEMLQVLDLSGSDMHILRPTFFQTLPNLTMLRLSNVMLDTEFIMYKGVELFKPLFKLEMLDLSGNNLISIPYDLFSSLVRLQVLNLARNLLKSLPNVDHLIRLRHLQLDFNSLTTIIDENRQMLDKTNLQNRHLQVSLSGNIFSCGCESATFLLWLSETNVHLDGRCYTCMDMHGKMATTKAVIEGYVAFNRKCTSGFWIIAASSGFSFILVSMVTAFVFIKNKMKVKLLLLRLIGRNIYPRKREEFEYDAYVIYTKTTLHMACTDMRRELEDVRYMKLNLRDRDHILGGYHTDDIVEAIKYSWKIILFVTDEFLQSDLALFTMCSCISSITLTTPDRLILLVDKNTRLQANAGFLLEAVSENNIMYINLHDLNYEGFWMRLHRLILHGNSIN